MKYLSKPSLKHSIFLMFRFLFGQFIQAGLLMYELQDILKEPH